ncbi:MAG TPA: UvrD-helicase domain-containing protein, partial [Tangfeifania sp.]|nr:UvrD-helicase domain-containing protein [Tangfeifania sp.]
ALTEALRTGNPEHFNGTIDMFPQEGKYHYDGHRKCNVCWDPAETLRNNYICPVCGKPVTVGVMNRVIHLSDREEISERPNKLPFRSIIPLREILSEISGVGVKSKKVEAEYTQTVQKLGKELDILLEISLEDIAEKSSKVLAEAIRRMRNREIIIQEGYDGEYGVIKVFRPGEVKQFEASKSLFKVEKQEPPEQRALINFDLKGIQQLLHQKEELENLAAEKAEKYETSSSENSAFNGLNPEQFAAVQHTDGPSLIIAGPGTGKTKTLISKIAWLIGNHIGKPEEILAITFTNKAAGELSGRLQELIKKKAKAESATIATFHAFGLSVLKEYYEKFNRTENFMLLDETLKMQIIQSFSEKNAREPKKLATEFSEIKSTNQQETALFKKYEKRLEELDAFDLDDLIVKPLELFEKDEKIREQFRQRFQYIFVDEYQDTNDAQYQLLRQLAPDSTSNLCVVGDPNQSIYGFRGANAGYIQRFTDDYPGAKVFRLKQSYRCSQTILSASADVLAQPSGLLEGISEGVQVSISEQPTGAGEAEFIARQIMELVGGVSFFSIDSSVTQGDKSETISSLSDLAVLCRTRSQFEAVAKALNDHQIPYQEVGTVPFFKDEPFQSFVDLLSLFLSGNFEKAAPVFKLKKREISKFHFEMAQEEKKKAGFKSFLNYVKKMFFSDEEFNNENWERFISMAENMQDLGEFISFLKLGSGSDIYKKNLEAVSLMTLHASKGLEFECVFIPGCEDGLLPYNLYKTEVDEEEEKRLLYVGMTRAKKLLYITHAKTRWLRGRKFNLPKSPFIASIQQELIQQIKNKTRKKPGEKDNQLSLF